MSFSTESPLNFVVNSLCSTQELLQPNSLQRLKFSRKVMNSDKKCFLNCSFTSQVMIFPNSDNNVRHRLRGLAGSGKPKVNQRPTFSPSGLSYAS